MPTDVLLPWLPLEAKDLVFVERRAAGSTRTPSLGSGDVLPWLSLG